MNFKDIPEVEPDGIDQAMIAEAEKENSGELYELKDLKWIPGYIDKQTALQELEKERLLLLDRRMYGAEHVLVRHAISVIEDIPPADVKPVVRGRWAWNKDNGYYYCSECRAVSPRKDQDGDYCYCPNYCHHCGADMRGDAE